MGGQTIKSLELVNGGGAIGLLTFYGNLLARNPDAVHLGPRLMATALICFGVGVFSAVAGSIMGYFSQLNVAAVGVELKAFCFARSTHGQK